MPSSRVNKFCRFDALANEASVEQFFVNRLLGDLGYGDYMIRPKASLPVERIQMGRSRRSYRPDYVLAVRGKARWVCEAKGPDEDPADWEGQAASYA